MGKEKDFKTTTVDEVVEPQTAEEYQEDYQGGIGENPPENEKE